MDYFINDEERYPYEDQRNESGNRNAEYVSPLVSKPDFRKTHYNPGGAGKAYKPPPKPQFTGFCSSCNMRLNSYTQSKSHYEGRVHAKRLKMKDNKGSTDEPPAKKGCGVRVGSNLGQFDSRLDDPTDPRVEAQLLNSEPPADADGKPAHEDKPKIRGKFHCELCNLALTCELQLTAHLAGTKHAKISKRTAQSSESDELKCEACNISVNSEVQFQQHIASKKHKQKLDSMTGQNVQETEQDQQDEFL